MTFEEIKEYFSNDFSIFEEHLTEFIDMDLQAFKKLAIEDMEKALAGEEIEPSLQENDIIGAETISFKLVYDLVSDYFVEAKEYSQHWALLLRNYILKFYPHLESTTNGIINLLALQNNMARLITLSEFLTYRKENEYKNVPRTFLEAFTGEF